MKQSCDKKIIMCAIVVLVSLSIFSFSSLATDLPIDIDAISDHGAERQDAITTRHGVDLFSPTSDAVNEALLERQNRQIMESKQSVFTQPHELIISDQSETLLQSAIEARLFETPFQSRRYVAAEQAETGISLVVVIPVLALSAGLGLIIAMYTRTKRKGQHVHNHNN